MNKIAKCIIAIVILLIANVVNVYVNIGNVYADENNKIVQNYINNRNLFNNKEKEYKYVDKKVDKEKKKHSTVAKKEVEEYLNENGIFDEDIKGLFSEKELRELKCEDLINSEIYVSYYAVEDTEELEDISIENKEMVELSDEQVNKYLAQKYFSKDTDLYNELENEFEAKKEKKKKSYNDKFLEAIGVKPIEVYAINSEGYSVGGNSDKDNPSMLKKDVDCNTERKEWIYKSKI